jgi:flagellar hook-length control protein FliK
MQQKTDMLKTAASMNKDREMEAANIAVDVLKHLSDKSAEEQLRAMQERHQMRQAQSQRRPESKAKEK